MLKKGDRGEANFIVKLTREEDVTAVVAAVVLMSEFIHLACPTLFIVEVTHLSRASAIDPMRYEGKVGLCNRGN